MKTHVEIRGFVAQVSSSLTYLNNYKDPLQVSWKTKWISNVMEILHKLGDLYFGDCRYLKKTKSYFREPDSLIANDIDHYSLIILMLLIQKACYFAMFRLCNCRF